MQPARIPLTLPFFSLSQALLLVWPISPKSWKSAIQVLQSMSETLRTGNHIQGSHRWANKDHMRLYQSGTDTLRKTPGAWDIGTYLYTCYITQLFHRVLIALESFTKPWSWNHFHGCEAAITEEYSCLVDTQSWLHWPTLLSATPYLQTLQWFPPLAEFPPRFTPESVGCSSNSCKNIIKSVLDIVFSTSQMNKVCLVWILCAIGIRPESIQVRTIEDEAGICLLNLAVSLAPQW